MVIEAEDEEGAKDEVMAYLFETYSECRSVTGPTLKPIIISVEECKNSTP